MLSERATDRLSYVAAILGREDRAVAELARFRCAPLRGSHRTHFAGETEFAEGDGVGRQRDIAKRRCDRKGDAEIGCGLVYAQTARDGCVHIMRAELQTDPALEHRKNHREARLIEIVGKTPRRTVARLPNERLYFDEYRTGTDDRRDDARSARTLVAPGEKELRGVRNFLQSR